MPPELLELLARIGELNETELAELATALTEYTDGLLDADPTDENLAALTEAADAMSAVAAAQEAIAADAADRMARRDALREQIQAMTGPGDEGAPEGEPVVETDPVAETEDAPAAEAEREPVAASGTPRQPRITGVNARRPAAMTPRPLVERAPVTLTAAGTFGSVNEGTVLTVERQAEAFLAAFQQSRGYRGPKTNLAVARAGQGAEQYAEDRFLGRDPHLNAARIKAVTSRQTIMASGGICAPIQSTYDLPIIGSDARPVRDGAMAKFGADRGGTRTIPPPLLTELDGAVGVWTEANDQNPSSPTTKPCLTVTCPDEDETVVDAITKCLEFGNFRARFFPEQVAAWVELASVQHAREAETRLLTAIGTGSTTVNVGQMLGTSRSVLAGLDRAIAGMKSRHRDQNLPLRFVAPFWLINQIQTDIARQMPVGTVDETMAIAEAQIQRWFTARGVNLTLVMDGETGQVFGAQGDGPLVGWPSTVITYLYPEGSWLFLDGGTLDLGIVRDSTLNGTNDFQMFAETFEAAHFHGVESQRITFDTCPDGSASALIDIDPCSTGS